MRATRKRLMLIDCPRCHTQFSMTIGECPVCRFIVPLTHQQQEEIWQRKAERRLNDGYDRRRVVQELIDEGFADIQAERIVRDAYAAVTRSSPHDRVQQITNMAIAGIPAAFAISFATIFYFRGSEWAILPILFMIAFYRKIWFETTQAPDKD